MTEPIVRPVAYEVTVADPEDIDADSFAIRVEYRGNCLWGVYVRHHWCLRKNGALDIEPQPSGRSETWLRLHRFPLDEALKRARELAPGVKINGHTWDEWQELKEAKVEGS